MLQVVGAAPVQPPQLRCDNKENLLQGSTNPQMTQNRRTNILCCYEQEYFVATTRKLGVDPAIARRLGSQLLGAVC